MSHTTYGYPTEAHLPPPSKVLYVDAATLKGPYVAASPGPSIDVTPLQGIMDDLSRQLSFTRNAVTALANKLGNAGLMRPAYDELPFKDDGAVPTPIRSPLEEWIASRIADLRAIEAEVNDITDRSVY